MDFGTLSAIKGNWRAPSLLDVSLSFIIQKRISIIYCNTRKPISDERKDKGNVLALMSGGRL